VHSQSAASLPVAAATRFLTDHLKLDAVDVKMVGEGAWSRCFGFRARGRELVIRFGRHVDDFEKDRCAVRYATPDLPIPGVLDLGAWGEEYYAISSYVPGLPLEHAAPEQWHALVPALGAAMEALRLADLGSTTGFGSWGADGDAPQQSWREHLLMVALDTPEMRTHGWRQRLATMSPEGEAVFAWGYEVLQGLALDQVPRALLHCDLINRNVHVEDDWITGIFDWGCSRYGDHLYELAWFDFWAPWAPRLDIAALRASLATRWRHAGYYPLDRDERLMACYLHIGLDHLAYNAYLGDWETLLATADRMRALVDRLQ
jgi:hygromycin-B 4-O-kinase